MSSSEYVERVRDARKRACVLRLKIYSVRSTRIGLPIFIFEGKTDIGPYETWIKRIVNNFNYVGIPANGKAQVLAFRESVIGSDDETFNSIYYFIDHDYDGLRGCAPSDNIFCTDTYSFENYLASHTVLESILNDEFECSLEHEAIMNCLELYGKLSSDFCEVMSDANLRLFISAKYGLNRGRIETRIKKFVTITAESVSSNYDSSNLSLLIPLLTEPTAEQVTNGTEEFEKVNDVMRSHRGKYIYLFFIAWLDMLAKARKDGEVCFREPQNIRYNRQNISDRSLASRSEIPNGLSDFIVKITKLEMA